MCEREGGSLGGKGGGGEGSRGGNGGTSPTFVGFGGNGGGFAAGGGCRGGADMKGPWKDKIRSLSFYMSVFTCGRMTETLMGSSL